MTTFLIVFFYCVCCACAGGVVLRALLSRARIDFDTGSLAYLVTAFLFGQALIASVWMLLGLMAWFNPVVVWTILAICFAGGLLFAKYSFAPLYLKLQGEIACWRTEAWGMQLVILLVLTLILLYGVGAFLRPPIGDAEAFYMAYAKIIAASHRLAPMQGGYFAFSQIGLLGELHFAALMLIDNVRAAKFFVWPISIGAALMLMEVGAKTGLGRRGKWITLIILFTSTTFTFYITDGKVDLFAAALGVAAIYWALNIETTERVAVPLTGLFLGFAAVAKFPYIVALLPPVLILVAWRRYLSLLDKGVSVRESVLPVLLTVFQLGAWIIIATIPHLIKNAALFQAPFAPFIGDPGSQNVLNQAWFSSEATRWIVLTYPLALVFGGYPMQGGNLSFLLLAFLPLVFLLPRPKFWLRSTLVQITVTGLIGAAIWVTLRPSVIAPRYILATLLILIPIVAYSAEYVYEKEPKPRWLSKGIIAFLLLALAIFPFPAGLPVYAVKFLQGKFSECELASNYCEPLNVINRDAPPGARVYFSGYHGYWLREDLLQCRDSHLESGLIAGVTNMEERFTTLYNMGFQYGVIEKASHAAMLSFFDISKVPEWLEVKALETEDVAIFQLTAKSAGHQPKFECRQVTAPAWDVVPVQ